MKKTLLYIAAVVLTAGSMSWGTPMISFANEDIPIEEAPVTSSVLAAFEEIDTVHSGPDLEVQKELAEAEAAQKAAEEAIQAAAQAQEMRQELVNYALQFVGGAYRAGGNDPNTGADCSGFVRYVMQHSAGVSMNRSSGDQARQGTAISAAEMQPGDLVFYGEGSSVNHVAMYIGDGQIVHASTYKTGIKVSRWNYRSPLKIVNVLG